jgi:hypothetical protein
LCIDEGINNNLVESGQDLLWVFYVVWKVWWENTNRNVKQWQDVELKQADIGSVNGQYRQQIELSSHLDCGCDQIHIGYVINPAGIF